MIDQIFHQKLHVLMVAGLTKKDSKIPGLKDGICLLPMYVVFVFKALKGSMLYRIDITLLLERRSWKIITVAFRIGIKLASA